MGVHRLQGRLSDNQPQYLYILTYLSSAIQGMLSARVHGGERSPTRLPSNHHCRWTRGLRHNEIPGSIPHLTEPTMGECMTGHSSGNGGCITHFASAFFIISNLLTGVHILQWRIFTINIVPYVNKINHQATCLF